MKTLILTLVGLFIAVIFICTVIKRYHKPKKINWVFVIELTSDTTAECRMCQLLEYMDENRIKVLVTRDNKIRYARLLGSNYYFEDQYEAAIDYVNLVRTEKLEEIKSEQTTNK